ncbi:MAG: SIR2 family protein [Caldilineaceae bacterium]
MCQQLAYPARVDERHDPFLLVAALGLPIYLTTDFHGLLANALRRAGCDPQIDYCRWNQKLIDLPSVLREGYTPTRQQPLVYHLHGWDGEPESMVLTDDDHYRFLMPCAQSAGKETDPVHSRVRRELSLSSLLLVGYSLRSAEFRSLFWGLIDTLSDKKASVVEIHLKPSAVEQAYYAKYLQKDHNLEVCWDDIDTYLYELYQEVAA